MKIVHDYPPLFDEIDARFHVRGKPMIYAWGTIIYNPYRVDVPHQLVAHEEIHGRRQGGDVAGWWRRYIDDSVFRRQEELVAHAAEYEALVRAGNRLARRKAMKGTAKRLANPVYGYSLSPARAEGMLKAYLAGKKAAEEGRPRAAA